MTKDFFFADSAEARRFFLAPDYLSRGSQRQQEAWRALWSARVFARLAAYSPALAGTVPLGVDVESSDLDVLCEAPALGDFEAALQSAFGARPDFKSRRALKQGLPAALCSFAERGFRVEIFGQTKPVAEQQAFRHLIAEARLLSLGGEAARAAIRALKERGAKTEPAFARYFGLSGDPYQTLLALADAPIEELTAAIKNR